MSRDKVLVCMILAALLLALPNASARPGIPASVQHVITIVMENEEYSQIIGNPSAPYQNGLVANYTSRASYYAVSHPSLPNYMALVSGTTHVSSDCLPSQCSTNSSSIVDLLRGGGLTWKEYAESIPTNCSQTVSADGLYQPKHDPFVYLSSITGNDGAGQASAYCDSHVVSFSQFWSDIDANRLPNYSFITPNNCDDGHSCSIATADAWLSTVVPRIESSRVFNATVLFVVYDEGSTNAGFANARGGQVPCLVISPLANHGHSSVAQYSHYSLLATTEALLGLGSLGRNDSTAQVMSDAFASCPSQGACGTSETSSTLSSMTTLRTSITNSSSGQQPTHADLSLLYSLGVGFGVAAIVLVVTRKNRGAAGAGKN